MKSGLDKLYAIVRRDLLTAIRHRASFAFTLVGLMVQLAAFRYLSDAIGPSFRPHGVEYFPYLLVGTGLYTFFLMSTQAFLSSVQEAQQTGTMEVLMTTSTPPTVLVILSSISAFAGNIVNLGVYLFAGVTIFRAPLHVNLSACLATAVLSLAIALAFGIAAATVQLTFQKGFAVVWLLGSALWLLSGAMFPIESLPRPLVTLAHATPFVYAVDGMRMALLRGETVSAIAPFLAALAGFGVVLLPLSLCAFSLSVSRARRNGTLSFY